MRQFDGGFLHFSVRLFVCSLLSHFNFILYSVGEKNSSEPIHNRNYSLIIRLYISNMLNFNYIQVFAEKQKTAQHSV